MVDQRLPGLVELTGGLIHSYDRAGSYNLRDAYVHNGESSTFVLPGYARPSTRDWFQGPGNWGFETRDDCTVRYFVNAGSSNGFYASYQGMADALDTVENENHFILLIGWTIAPGTPMRPEGHSFSDYLWYRARRRVRIRALHWENTLGDGGIVDAVEEPLLGGLGPVLAYERRTMFPDHVDQVAQVAAINRIDEGLRREGVQRTDGSPLAIAVLDGATRGVLGCHHQKILLVYGSEGLIGFFGGVDINEDRVFAESSGRPMHDVHCRVVGAAANDLLELFVSRWKSCPAAVALEANPPWIAAAGGVTAPTGSGARQKVRIVQTVGKAGSRLPRASGGADFQSDYYSAIKAALSKARRFIYLQDQYLWHEEMANYLNRILTEQPSIRHLTILIPHISISTDAPSYQRAQRRRVFWCLKGSMSDDEARSRIGVYVVNPPEGWGGYNHSKLWIIDDECAIIGSANCNRRGYQHDSESGGVVASLPGSWSWPSMTFAHKLRIELWKAHLGMSDEELGSLYDGAAAVHFWQHPPATARIRTYLDRYGDESDRLWWDLDGFDHEDSWLDTQRNTYDPAP
jgi:phosphatidylserine/phosphatidylglycerophosphate/cardiolipin synthase-like enzyme